jgi:hypothetical protein
MVLSSDCRVCRMLSEKLKKTCRDRGQKNTRWEQASSVRRVCRVSPAPAAVGAFAASAAVQNEALASNASCVNMKPHCHNCRCPEIGQNASNELCKTSAKAGTANFKRPPCTWAASDSTIIEAANRAARFRQLNWGTLVENDAEWPTQKFNLGEKVMAHVFHGNADPLLRQTMDVEATIVGCFIDGITTAQPRTTMYYIRADNGRHYYVSVSDTHKIVVPMPIAFRDGAASDNEGNNGDASPAASPASKNKDPKDSDEFDDSPPSKKKKRFLKNQTQSAAKKQRPGKGAKGAKDKANDKGAKEKPKGAKGKSNTQNPPLLLDAAAPQPSSQRFEVFDVSDGTPRRSPSHSPTPRQRSPSHSPPQRQRSPPRQKNRSQSPAAVESPSAGGRARSESPKAGKHTYWVHTTRIATLRLIGNFNPWSAKDSGATWQKIATQIHHDTKHVRERHPRTKKLMNCQVVATNGQALMMWYIRQAEKMDKTYSEKREKTTSGQTGMRKKAIEAFAAENNENAADIEKEWDVLRHLKELKDEAELARKHEKSRSAALKSLKDDEMPAEIRKVACDSKEVCIQGIRLLQKKKRQWETEVALAQKLGRAPVVSASYNDDMKLLDDLQKQRKTYSDGDDDDEEEVQAGATSSDARAGKNDRGLKSSFGMLTQAVQQVSAMLQHDEFHAQTASKTLTTEQLKTNLAQLDSDIQNGLMLEHGERALVRELCLKRYAQGLGNSNHQH